MSIRNRNIHSLTHAVLSYLEKRKDHSIGVRLALRRLSDMNLSLAQIIDTKPVGTRHQIILDEAINEIDHPSLDNIALKLKEAKEYLVWREDNNNYYDKGADLGEGYRKCNLHTVLIGPDACGYYNNDFILGFFMLGPWTLYRDHRHPAPELYLNLSNRSGFRLKSQDWHDHSAGSFVWNEANSLHAIRVYEKPFISIFIWLENIGHPCIVVPVNDWAEVEANLKNRSYASVRLKNLARNRPED